MTNIDPSKINTDIKDSEPDRKKERENQISKIGYNSMLVERYPISEDIGECSNEASAYFFALEEEFLNPPENLWFEHLKHDIPEKHHERLEDSWRTVVRLRYALDEECFSLKRIWEEAPILSHKETEDLMAQTPIKISKKIRAAIKAIAIPLQQDDKSEATGNLKHWKRLEKNARGGFYKAHKNYIAALRTYYELLLERSKESNESNQEYTLPKNHPLREQIVINNRYLRIIQTMHASISVAKAEHHEQKEGRIRKTSEIPYVYHSLAVTMEIALDVLPFIIEADKLTLTPSLLFASAPLHDTPEDTRVKIKSTVKKLMGQTNDLDSTIMPVIKSGFGIEDEKMIENHIDIIRDKSEKQIGQILRIVSNNTVLEPQEKQKALIARKKLKTFKKYREDFDDGKMAKLIDRMESISESPAVKQSALIIKLADRISNISEMEGLPPEKQLATLRSTVSRLLNYAIEDYKNHKDYPLYNTLPRLINVTINRYRLLHQSNPESITSEDNALFSQLLKWSQEIKTLDLPEKVQEIIKRYRQRKSQTESPPYRNN